MNNTYIILFLFVFLNNSIFSCTPTLSITHIYIFRYIFVHVKTVWEYTRMPLLLVFKENSPTFLDILHCNNEDMMNNTK